MQVLRIIFFLNGKELFIIRNLMDAESDKALLFGIF